MRFELVTAILTACTVPVLTVDAYGTTPEPVDAFLPQEEITAATYVQIEQDPGFDEFTRSMREATEGDREWYESYAREHQANWDTPLPWHERFGVSREEYEHYVVPMNHFHEIARQQIEFRTVRANSHIRIELTGENLLLTSIDIDVVAQTATTPLDVIPLKGFVDLERASLPPGIHRGVHFRTPDKKIRETHRRESMVIGEVRELDLGIIHYQMRSKESTFRIYVTFPRKAGPESISSGEAER